MADNLLDTLIADQNARGLRPASPAQLGTGQAGLAPTTPQVTISSASPLLPFGEGFSQTNWNQNPAQLRQQLNLEELQTRAAANKFALERAQSTAPLQDRLLQAQIAMTGAHERYMQTNDAQVHEHTAGFLKAMADPNAPGPHEPGHDKYVYAQMFKFPRVVETAGGQKILGNLGRTNDQHVSIEDLRKQFGGEVASITVGKNGQPSVTLKPPAPDAELHKAAKGYGLTLDQVRNPINAEVGRLGKKGEMIDGKDVSGGFIGDEAGNIVRVQDKEGKKVQLSVKEYQRLGGTFSAEGAAKQGAGPIKVTSVEEANKLPSGTTFLTPDGKLKRKP